MRSVENVVYSFVLTLVAGVGISLAFYIVRRRTIKGVRWISAIILLSAWMGVSYALQLVAVTAETRLFWVQVEYIGIVAIIPILLVFALRYSGQARFIKPSFYIALLVEPIVILALVWTIHLHSGFYQSYRLETLGDQVVWQVSYGIWFWMHIVYTALLYLFSLALFLLKAIQSINQQRRQAFLIFGLTLLVGLGNVIYISRNSPFNFDFGPLFSLISSILVAWSILRYRFLELTPIALETVLHSMADGVILIDPQGMVADMNPAAERIAGWRLEQPLATSLEKVLPELAAQIKPLAISAEANWMTQLGPQNDQRTFAATISPVSQGHGRAEGRLILLRDETEALRIHQELEARESELRLARNFLEKIIATVPTGIAIYDLVNGRMEFINRDQALGGISLDAYNEMALEERCQLIHPADLEKFLQVIQHLNELADGEVRSLEFRLKNPQGWEWTRMYFAIFQRDDEGKIAKILTINDDISGYKQALDLVAGSEKSYRSLFEGMPIGLYRATRDGRLLDVNPAFVYMLRYPNRESILNKNAYELFKHLAEHIGQQKPVEWDNFVDRFDQQVVCWDGDTIWASHMVRVIPDVAGEQIYEGSIEDITHRKEVEVELQASEKKFKSIFDLSPNSILLADLSANIIDCNLSTLHLHTFSDKEEMIGSNFTALVIPEDHPRFFNLMETTLEDGCSQVVELTLMRKNGQYFEAEISTSIVPNPAGRPTRMIITVSDISARKGAESELQDAQRQLAQRVSELETRTRQITLLTEMSNMLQVCLKPDEAYSFISKYAARVFPGVTGVLMILDANRKLLVPEAHWGEMEVEPLPYLPGDCWALRSGQAYLAPEDNPARLCRHFHLYPVSSSLCVPILSEGEIIGVINLLTWKRMGAMAEDQFQLASAMAEQIGLALSNLQLRDNLHQQAIHDPLTGLYNRYYLREAIENELAIAEESGRPLAVVMIDLDHFKQMNTRYGHLNVDVMLSEFGKLIHAFSANGEVALRYGGDEFVLILPNATLEQAVERSEQLRRRVRQLTVHLGDLSIQNLTLSIGIAGWPMHGRTFGDLLKAADGALFHAKEERDRVEIAR
jgi:diguanylate cyclase (GGDEF)-like protein/PAS domain S-box-containing protein